MKESNANMQLNRKASTQKLDELQYNNHTDISLQRKQWHTKITASNKGDGHFSEDKKPHMQLLYVLKPLMCLSMRMNHN